MSKLPEKSITKPVYCFIDASNLFYGGEKSLGWKIDYQKLIKYIRRQYKVKKVFYYAGVELNGFKYSVLEPKPINLDNLIKYLKSKLKKGKLSKQQITSILNNIQRVKFYSKLSEFGYKLILKPIKIFKGPGRKTIKKANCDVDMTFDLVRYFDNYSGVLILSGDGDFAVVLKYIKKKNKELKILARGERTAREIKQLVGSDFRDFSRLRNKLEYKRS